MLKKSTIPFILLLAVMSASLQAQEMNTNVSTIQSPVTLTGKDVSKAFQIVSQDPYENFNRHSFALNQAMDKAVYIPVATLYRAAFPWPIRKGVANFFNNLSDVTTFFNEIFQFKGGEAVSDMGRVVINTTLGVGGLFDVATHFGFKKHNEDFGKTLLTWGNKTSPYFVIPFLGPSTVRDALGDMVDLSCWSVPAYIHSNRLKWGLRLLNMIEVREGLLGMEDVLNKAALDPYAFERDAYLQKRGDLQSGTASSHNDDPFVDESIPSKNKDSK